MKNRFNSNILNEAMSRFGIDKAKSIRDRGFTNYIYEYKKNNNNFIEKISDSYGNDFIATSFVKAKGHSPWDKKYLCTEEEFANIYGNTVGKLHNLTKKYNTDYLTELRPDWNNPQDLKICDYIPGNNRIIKDEYNNLIEYISKLPKTMNSYGLIHGDMKKDNFFIDSDNNITVYGFDGCHYNWFIDELAWIFFRYIPENNYIPPETFIAQFLMGYTKENKLDPYWLKEIKYFLKLKEILFYALAFKAFDKLENMPLKSKKYMCKREEKIINDIPYINIEFEKFTKYL